MEIDNKNSEEKEAKQPAEIPEKEKDHVLRTAVILATVIIVLGGIVVAVRLNNPKQDTTKGRKILSEMDRTDVGKVNKKKFLTNEKLCGKINELIRVGAAKILDN